MSEEQAQQLLYQMQMLEGYFSELTQKEASIISIIYIFKIYNSIF